MMKIAKAFSVIVLVLLKTQGVLSEKKEEGRRQFIKRAERSSSKLRKDIKRTERSSSKLRKEGDKSVSKRLAYDPGEPPWGSLEHLRIHYWQDRNGFLGHFCTDYEGNENCRSPLNCDHSFCGGRDNGSYCRNDDECRTGVSCAGSSYGHNGGTPVGDCGGWLGCSSYGYTGYCGGGWNTAPCSHDDHCINICIGVNLDTHHMNGRCGRAAEDGESCTEDRECINQCNGNICMLIVGIGGTCASSPQCQGNLECSGRTCVLKRNNVQCPPIKFLGWLGWRSNPQQCMDVARSDIQCSGQEIMYGKENDNWWSFNAFRGVCMCCSEASYDTDYPYNGNFDVYRYE